MYNTIQMFVVNTIFLIFLKNVSYPHQGWIYLIENTVKQ